MFAAIGVALGVFALVIMLVEPPRKTTDPVAFLAFGFAAIGAGSLLLAAREQLPTAVSLFGGNLAVIFGMAYQYWGISVASGRTSSRAVRLAVLAVLFVAAAAIYWAPPPWQYIALNFLYAGLFAATSLAAIRWRQTVLPLRVVLGTGFAMICLLFLVRAWEFWSGHIVGAFYSQANRSASGLVLGALLYAMALTTGFGIFMMRKRFAEQRLAQVLREQGTIIETLPTGIIIARNRKILTVNSAMEQMVGWGPGELTGQSMRALYPTDREFELGRQFHETVVANGQNAGEVQFVRRSGETFWVQLHVRVLEGSGDPVMVVASVTDISDLRRMRDEFERQASIDELTGLPNRRSFLLSAGQLLAAAHRADQPLALAVIDLDGFKETNDTHGHAAGDAALVAVTQVFLETFRDMDVIARVGGDEFAVILPDSDLIAAESALTRFTEALKSREMAIGDGLAASIGIAQARPDETLDDLMAAADQQMYLSKRRGGGTHSSRKEPETAETIGRQ